MGLYPAAAGIIAAEQIDPSLLGRQRKRSSQPCRSSPMAVIMPVADLVVTSDETADEP